MNKVPSQLKTLFNMDEKNFIPKLSGIVTSFNN